MELSEYEYSAIVGMIVIGCFLALAIAGVFTNTDFEGGKEKMLEQRAIKYGEYIIRTKGIRDNYQIFNVDCPGSFWYHLEYHYESMKITMQVIYWESENDFTFKEGSFSQVPI